MKDFKLTFLNQNLFLHPFRAIYWEDRRTLLLADIHLGKAAHFRKNGIPIPCEIHQTDLDRLSLLCDYYQPIKMIVLGDFFHSEMNGEWHQFTAWKNIHAHLAIDLVKGNHDILDAHRYAPFKFCEVQLNIDPFSFTHFPVETEKSENLYNICGHIHPSVRIRSAAKQSYIAPCFSFGKNQAVLPAFGRFTGKSKIIPKHDDLIFVIVDDKVIKI